MSEQKPQDFQNAAEEKEIGVGREILNLIRDRKKWWLIPIIIMLAGIGVLIILGATGAAPFIYTLF